MYAGSVITGFRNASARRGAVRESPPRAGALPSHRSNGCPERVTGGVRPRFVADDERSTKAALSSSFPPSEAFEILIIERRFTARDEKRRDVNLDFFLFSFCFFCREIGIDW